MLVFFFGKRTISDRPDMKLIPGISSGGGSSLAFFVLFSSTSAATSGVCSADATPENDRHRHGGTATRSEPNLPNWRAS
jgi:hypothetical protein